MEPISVDFSSGHPGVDVTPFFKGVLTVFDCSDGTMIDACQTLGAVGTPCGLSFYMDIPCRADVLAKSACSACVRSIKPAGIQSVLIKEGIDHAG